MMDGELKKVICRHVNQNVGKEKIETGFKEIARELFFNYIISKGEDKYKFTILEFYYYSKNSHEDTTTYPRTCPVGSYFFHQSGFDISFESDFDKGYYGGILVRGIEPIEISANTRCLLEGKCKDYLKDHPLNICEWLFGFKSQEYTPKNVSIPLAKDLENIITKKDELFSEARKNISNGLYSLSKYRFKSGKELQSTHSALSRLAE